MSASSGETNNNSSNIREDIIQTAVKFLQNPKVVNTGLAQKQTFLQRKGLSDQEIQIACEKAGAYILHENQNRVVPPPALQHVPIPYNATKQIVHYNLLDKLKEIVHNIALVSAVVYAIYKFYEKFIKPFLFGGKKKKSVEEVLEDLNKSVDASIGQLKENLDSVKVEVEKINRISESSTNRQLQNLQSEISTVKGLLLSRKQFPSVANAPVVPPSIPAWQLSSATSEPDADPKSEDLMEIGSGSGSSDPEHGTKNSDSSLEIM